MAEYAYIPLSQLYMKNGVNVGGFQYRQYHTDGTWELHLHAGGGIVRLRNHAMGAVFYVPTSSVESCDGMPIVGEFSGRDSTAHQMAGPLPIPNRPATGSSGGLISNQVAHKVEAPAIVTIDGPEVLDPVDNLSKEQKAAKAAHFKPVEPEPEPMVSAPAEPTSPNAYKSLAVPKPAKRKPGRPRKVIAESPVSTS